MGPFAAASKPSFVPSSEACRAAPLELLFMHGKVSMSSEQRSSDPPDSLSVRIGNWFEAYATGRGVIAISLVALILAAAAALKFVLGV